MRPTTADLWAKHQDPHPGDRHRLFRAVAEAFDVTTVLYPGCFVDIAPSFVWPSVTYVDVDRRAGRFFDDTDGVRAIVASQDAAPSDPDIRFVQADYAEPLGLADDSFDLLVSLYAGPISRWCTRYLRIDGLLLVNPSHGDVALASIDPRHELAAVVHSHSDDYTVSTAELELYLVPKDRSTPVTVERIERTGRGVDYTRSAFAYLFRRIG